MQQRLGIDEIGCNRHDGPCYLFVGLFALFLFDVCLAVRRLGCCFGGAFRASFPYSYLEVLEDAKRKLLPSNLWTSPLFGVEGGSRY